ncbi:MAG: ABC transporter permease [Roseivirga sp.]
MLKSYLKIAVRGIFRNPGYAAINIFGLSIGITCFLLIFLVVRYELSFDKFHSDAERIFRVDNALHLSSGIYKYPNGPAGVGPSMYNEIPEVIGFTRLGGGGQQAVFEVGTELFRETDLFYADSSFFSFFDFELLLGNKNEVLKNPLMAVLSEKAAVRYFGKANAVGEVLVLKGNQEQRFQVSGIMKDLPANSHIQCEVLLSNETLRSNGATLDSWNAGGSYTYIKLNDVEAKAGVEAKMMELRDRYVEEENRLRVNPSMIALTDIHLHSNLRNEIVPNGNIDIVYVFSAIAVFILLIAAINYMNLATARSAKRAKEVGMRKVLGAYKKQLVTQFMGESLVLVIISALISFVIVVASLGLMADFTGKALELSMLFDPLLLSVFLGVLMIIGFGSGSYPALFLSSFKPVVVLKGKLSPGMNSSGVLRKGLVVFQFAISIMLMIGTYAVYDQLSFMKNKSLGFQKENMLVVSNTQNAVTPQLNAFKNELLKNTQIESVTASFSKPGGLRPIIFIKSETVIDDEANLNLAAINIDFDYMSTFGINILKGRDFDRSVPVDSTQSIMLNEQAARELNVLEDPIGRIIQVNLGGNWVDKKVIGLVADVNFEPLQRKTEATFYGPIFGAYSYLYVKVKPGNQRAAIDHINAIWDQFAPQQPFEYSYLESDLNELYASEEQLSQVVIFFAVLAILIACLGLFGLASFATEQRIKEIGVRKVLGASVAQVLLLLSKDFVLLILIAFVVAAPVSYYLTDWWLQDFAFKVNIGWLTFFLAGIIAILIALITVGYKAINAARSNPVKALRFE